MTTLPVRAGWELHAAGFVGTVYGALRVDFRMGTGTLEHRGETAPLAALTRSSPRRFGARYETRQFHGIFDADLREDRSLHLSFKGTPPFDACDGRPLESVVDWIAADFQGTYDIAGAALALMDPKVGMQWSNDGSGFAQA